MNNLIQGIASFQGSVFPGQRQMYQQLVRDGQHPSALIIACADSRVSPEHITQAGPGDLFVWSAASPRRSSTPWWRSACATSSSAAIPTAAP
jgi:carbonic anhydrase